MPRSTLCYRFYWSLVFEKNQLQQALRGAAYIPEQCGAANQLNLLNS